MYMHIYIYIYIYMYITHWSVLRARRAPGQFQEIAEVSNMILRISLYIYIYIYREREI